MRLTKAPATESIFHIISERPGKVNETEGEDSGDVGDIDGFQKIQRNS